MQKLKPKQVMRIGLLRWGRMGLSGGMYVQGDVAIDIKYCGVCYLDIHQARDEWGGVDFPDGSGA